MKLERHLKRITDLIVQCCDPDQVLLFGSYAKQQANHYSDLDILVIGHFYESPYLRKQELQQLLGHYPIGIDLHMMTPEEVSYALKDHSGFVSSIVASSKLLYEKSVDGY